MTIEEAKKLKFRQWGKTLQQTIIDEIESSSISPEEFRYQLFTHGKITLEQYLNDTI